MENVTFNTAKHGLLGNTSSQGSQHAAVNGLPFANYLSQAASLQSSASLAPFLSQHTALSPELVNPQWEPEQDLSFNDVAQAVDDEVPVEEAASDQDEPVEAAEDNDSTDATDDEQVADRGEDEASPDEKAVAEERGEQSDDTAVTEEVAAAPVEQVTAKVTSQTAETATSARASLGTAAQTEAVARNQATDPATQAKQAQASASQPNQGQAAASATNATVKVTANDVVSQPSNTLAASATVSAMSNAEGKQGPNASAKATEKSNGLATATAANANNGKGSTPGMTAQAVQAANPGHGGNATNTSARGQGDGALTGIQNTASASAKGGTPQAGAPSFTDSLAAASRANKPTETQGLRKPLNVSAADQIAVQIKKAAGANKDQISIKLNPAELGRVDVKMELNDQGGIRAMITAERPETLDLLQRDSRLLEKALQEAGLKADGQSLSFNLRQDGAGQQPGEGKAAQNAASDQSLDEGDVPAEQQQAEAQSSHDGELDISI